MQGTSTQITLSLGQTVNCVFTNTLKSASLIVTKVVVNDSGGNATADDFPLLLNNTPLVDANAVELAPGTYLISGKTPKGYLLSFTGDCADNGVVRLVPGQVNRCVATIDDIPTGTPVAAMVMVKTAGLLPDTCALDVDISVVKGSKVYYCYTVTNIGNVPLSTHSLTDTQFGNVFSALHKSILPGQTVSTVDLGIEQSADILDEVFGTGTWSALASDDVLSTTASSLTRVTLGSEDFSLTVTAAYEPQAQGGHTTIGAKIVYQIHLVNTGTARLYNTQISFLVPAGTVYRAGADLWSCEDGAPVETLCRYTVGLLKPGEEVVIPLTLNIITEIIVERLALQIRADSAGTPITPASSKELLVYGPDALNGSYLFLPHLQQ